jgi:hypothetical protein
MARVLVGFNTFVMISFHGTEYVNRNPFFVNGLYRTSIGYPYLSLGKTARVGRVVIWLGRVVPHGCIQLTDP